MSLNNNKLRITALTLASALAIPGLAAAKDGAYLSAHGGIGFTPSTTISSKTNNVTSTVNTDYKDFFNNYNFGAAIGYKMGPVRYEGEFTYIRPQVDALKASEAGTFQAGSIGLVPIMVPYKNSTLDKSPSGGDKFYAGFANVYYDFDNDTNFTPYVGAGVGYARLTHDVSSKNTHVTGSANGFAYQGIAGVKYKINDNASVFVDYRYIGTTKMEGTYTNAALTSGFPVKEKVRFQNHSFNVGLNYSFT